MRGSLGVGAAMLLPRSLLARELPADITTLSASALSAAIRERQVSCLEVMEAYLARIHRFNPTYNAIVGMAPDDASLSLARDADQALARGNYRGWMHGMPHAVKDLAAAAGLRYTSGSPLYADRIATTDSATVARMRAQGAIFIGKTNAPEFGLGSQSYNPVFGATGSAYNPALTAGGSSGGAASGLGTHMLPVADGSDAMGSLRNPGAFNNVIGFRPSLGLVAPGDPLSRGLSTSGPMGRNTEDTIRLLHTLVPEPGPDQPSALHQVLSDDQQFELLSLRGLNVGWLGSYDGYLAMEPGVLELCESSLAAVATAGAIVEPARPAFDMSTLWDCWLHLRHLSRVGMQALYQQADTRPLLKPELAWEIENSLALTGNDIQAANRVRARWYREIGRLFEIYDVLALPTAQVFPFSKDVHWPREIDGHTMDTYHRWMEVVIGGSLAGIPVVNVPAGFDAQGRPMGMQIMGRYGDDRRVLQVARAYEAVTGYLDRRPRLVEGV
jgi:amidase